MTNTRWRWGFWDFDREKRDYVFRPENKMDELGLDSLVLAACDYETRVADLEDKDVLTILESCMCGPTDETTVSVLPGHQAVIGAAPTLVTALRRLIASAEACSLPEGCELDDAIVAARAALELIPK